MRRKRLKKQSKSSLVIAVLLLVIIGAITIGYSVFVAELSITNTVVKVRPDKVVRVTNVTTTSGAVSELDYNVASVVSTIAIPAGSSITYNTTVTNLGNVPVAISDVNFNDGTNTISGLTTTINSSNYVKICNGNNCTGPISKDVSITVTNNGSSTYSGNLIADLTFKEVYNITYEGNKIGEALAGSTFTYTFQSNYPDGMSKTSGTCGTFNYNSTTHTVTINDVESDLAFINQFTINFEGSQQGTVAKGNTYTYEFTSKWPKSISCVGSFGNQSYTNDILTLTNVHSNVDCTPTYGEIHITSLSFLSADSVNSSEKTPATFDGMDADFDIIYERAANATTNDFIATYNVTINNEFYNDYIFNGFDFNPEINVTSGTGSAYIEPSLVGITQGETIPARTSKNFKLVLELIATNPNATYGTEITGEGSTTEPEVEEGALTASISPLTGNLSSPNTSATFNITVHNTYASAKSYTLTSGSSNFEVLFNNSPVSKTIAGESDDSYQVTVKTTSSAMFKESTATTTIYLIADGMANYSIGNLTFTVDVSQGVDITPPTVSITDFGMVYEGNNNFPSVGKLKVTWSGSDNQGGSGMLNYTAKLYDSTGTKKDEQTVGYTTTSVTFPSSGELADGTYYAVVYGEDNYHNSGASYESQASTSPYADITSSNAYKWRFTVTNKMTNLKCNTYEAFLNQTYTCTMSATGSQYNGDYVPDSMTSVKMGNTTLGTNTNATSYYTYTKNTNTSATLKVFNVTGNIELNATAASSEWCLIEGTKVLMADGTYKIIDNVGYDDLLLVHNYETGALVKEYPIWIEKEIKTTEYQKTTFSDGTVLKTVGWHGVFSLDLNRFVAVDNPEEFHIGTKIAKLNKNKTGYNAITVTNIEKINETVNHYHVVSTRYYNIIANDILTTDGNVILSNLYGFSDNITWPTEVRNNALKDVYTYEELSEVIPYYMFQGLRVEEGKFLNNYGISLDIFKYYLSTNQSNPNLLREPIKILNHNMWMVTTSEDNVTILNKTDYLKPEGSIYILPKSKNNKKITWYNTSNGKYYKSGDKITIDHGMYFEAVYE